MPLNFLTSIYNGQITLKETEFLKKDLYDETNELKPKNVKEEEEIYGVLIQANDMFEYRDKIIEAFRDETTLSEHF